MSTLPNVKRNNEKRPLPESSPLTSKTETSMHRKRKCPLQPKQVSENSDELEIITIDCESGTDGSSDGVDKSNRRINRSNAGDLKSSASRKKVSQVLGANFRRGNGSKIQSTSGDGVSSPSCSVRASPLPHINWADCQEVWELMLQKDESYTRHPLLMGRHPSLQPRMRSILLDWLSEVSEVYKMHRETFYLALDFVDRYLSIEANVPKQSLQLIGITCLFIASKIEEIYPPKLADFSFVTDGACDEADILAKELVLLKTLNWDLTPMTVNGWLCVYLQLFSQLEKENASSEPNLNCVEGRVTRRNSPFKNNVEANDDIMIPGYPSKFFSQIAHLVDLTMLDVSSLHFSYSIIAASALYHFTDENIVYQCTGFKMPAIKDCVMWMTPFALAIRDEGFDNPKISKVGEESVHNIMSHTVDLTLLEKAHQKQLQSGQEFGTPISSKTGSPVVHSSNLLTPPKSSSKSKM